MIDTAHNKLRSEMIDRYLKLGYNQMRGVSTRIIPGYMPDAVMENDNEIVLLEAVDTSYHSIVIPEQLTFNGKRVILIKNYVPDARVLTSKTHNGKPTHPRFNINIDDDLAKEFKIKIIKRFGSLRGHVEQSFEEAIRCWLKQNKEG